MAEAETQTPLPLPEFTKPVKLLVVVAPYYRDIADDLLTGALAVLESVNAGHEVVEVPGALEVPAAIALAHRLSNFDGYVALGCVIRGETTHYDTVCNDSSRGLSLLGLQGCAIGNGILTVENRAQAEVRANPDKGDKGGGAARAALHLIALARRWGDRTKGIGFKPLGESIQIAGGSQSGPASA